MPFFLIVPAWILCSLAGAILFFSRLRSLSLYLLLGSTGFTVFSFLCSTAVLLLAGKWPQLVGHSGLLAIVGYVAALLAGGAVGGVGGLVLAYRLNRGREVAGARAQS